MNDVSREVASRARRRAAQRSDGYSLLQIVITFAVVGVLASFALPSTSWLQSIPCGPPWWAIVPLIPRRAVEKLSPWGYCQGAMAHNVKSLLE